MTSVLVVNSSPVDAYSVSRQLTRAVVESFSEKDVIVTRDVGLNPLPHLTEATVGAFFARSALAPEQQEAVALSDQLVAEFLAAEVVVIGSPMHNFGITSGLKAWIDHIVRAGKTFAFSAAGPVGLATGKKIYVLTARGSDYGEGSALRAMDFQETYLRTIFGFIGVTDIAFIHCQGLGVSDEVRAAAIAATTSSINGQFRPAIVV